jgi:hypothetical protein
MQSIWDNVPQKTPILGDFAMIVGNPYAMNTLVRATFSLLLQGAKTKDPPKVYKLSYNYLTFKKNDNLRYTVQLMALGLAAFDMQKSQQFKFPHYQKELYSSFLVALQNMIAEDIARVERQEFEAPIALKSIDKNIETFFLNNALARMVRSILVVIV